MKNQRKSHRKSREGCGQCKERRVKCNEVHPQCLNCERLDILCSFSSPTLAITPLNDDSVADLELLEYWHRHRLTPGMSERARELEHGYVRLGFSHHYLLNSILALAALQRFDEDRSCTRWYVRAVAHQQAAISRARPHFQRLDSSHYEAMLAFSTFNSLYNVAEPLHRPTVFNYDGQDLDPVKEFIHIIRLGRCTAAFVQQHLSCLVTSDPFMAAKFWSNQLTFTQGIETRFPQLALLRSSIDRLCEGETRSVCLHAVELLFVGIGTLIDNPGDSTQTQVIFSWAKEVDSMFLDMCSAQHPIALIILAHYAALLSLSQGLWFLQCWPTVLLGHIRERLKDWEAFLQWPMEMISRHSVVASLSSRDNRSPQCESAVPIR